MIKLIAIAAFVLGVTFGIATSAQAMPAAPVQAPEGIVTDVAYGCGPGRTRVRGVCVARTTIRQTSSRSPQMCVLARRRLRPVGLLNELNAGDEHGSYARSMFSPVDSSRTSFETRRDLTGSATMFDRGMQAMQNQNSFLIACTANICT